MGESLLMERHFLEEDTAGNILIVDRHGQEVARFAGADALEQAVKWAAEKYLTLYSSISPTTLFDHQNLYFRRKQHYAQWNRVRGFPLSVRRIRQQLASEQQEPLLDLDEDPDEDEI
jgi:hypothetical protein